MKSTAILTLTLAAAIAAGGAARADYRATALALNPTHYYALDETGDAGTVFDTGVGTTVNGVHDGGPFGPNVAFEERFGVSYAIAGMDGPQLPGFDANNKSLFHNNIAGVNLGSNANFDADVMTVAGWFNSRNVNTGDRLFTNNIPRPVGGTTNGFQIVLGEGVDFVIATGQGTGPDHQLYVPGVPVKNQAWHHFVVVRNGDDAQAATVVIDGVDHSAILIPTDTDWGTNGSNARIGSRTDSPGDGNPYTFNGNMDEVGIWLGTALSVAQAQALYQAAVAPAVPGDFDGDNDVDGADFVVWQTNFPTQSGAMLDDGDADGDGDVDGADFVVWQTNFPTTPGGGVSAVPEPQSVALLAAGSLLMAGALRRGRLRK